jgi:hypothetical protein
MRTITLRPLLSAFIHAEAATAEADRPVEDILTYRYAHQAALLCIKLAQDAVDIIFDRLPESPIQGGCLSEWWYNIMYIYTAGTILVAAQVMPDVPSDQLLSGPLVESWNKIRRIFQIYQNRRSNISRLLAMLELLYNRVPEKYYEFKQGRERARTNVDIADDLGNITTVGNSELERQLAAAPEICSRRPNEDTTLNTIRDSAIQGSNELQSFDVLDFLFDPNDMSWLNDLPMWDE